MNMLMIKKKKKKKKKLKNKAKGKKGSWGLWKAKWKKKKVIKKIFINRQREERIMKSIITLFKYFHFLFFLVQFHL